MNTLLKIDLRGLAIGDLFKWCMIFVSYENVISALQIASLVAGFGTSILIGILTYLKIKNEMRKHRE